MVSTALAWWLSVWGLAASVGPESVDYPAYVLVGARVWDGAEFARMPLAIRDGLVAPDDGRSAPQIDLSGFYIIPGLIDAHAHFVESGLPRRASYDASRAATNARVLLLSGVTLARVHLFDLEAGPALAAAAADPCVAAPEILLGGPGLFGGRPGLEAPQVWGFDDADDLGRKLRRLAAAGVTWVAVHETSAWTGEQLRALQQGAEALGLKLMVDGGSAGGVDAALALAAGSIEYLPEDALWTPGQLERLAAPDGPFVAPPIGYYLGVAEAIGSDSPLGTVGRPAHLTVDGLADYDAAYRENAYLISRAALADRFRQAFRQLLAADAKVVLATDVGSPGQFHDRAIWTEIRAWLTLGAGVEVTLAAATSKAAGLLGRPELGRLEPGRRADFVILKAPPSATSTPADVVGVARRGILHGGPHAASLAGAEPILASSWCSRRRSLPPGP